MKSEQSTAGLVYASAVAADAFARSLLQAHDVPAADAAIVAGCLVSADLRGVDTHGLCRLPIYLERMRKGLINPKPNLAAAAEVAALQDEAKRAAIQPLVLSDRPIGN